MEILKLKNNYLKKTEGIEYGCECSRCGTVFTFHRSEATAPRCIYPNSYDYTIRCPNCNYLTWLDKCKKFNDEYDKKNFMKLYNIEEE